jgi:hypothetical protein
VLLRKVRPPPIALRGSRPTCRHLACRHPMCRRLSRPYAGRGVRPFLFDVLGELAPCGASHGFGAVSRTCHAAIAAGKRCGHASVNYVRRHDGADRNDLLPAYLLRAARGFTDSTTTHDSLLSNVVQRRQRKFLAPSGSCDLHFFSRPKARCRHLANAVIRVNQRFDLTSDGR